MKQPSAAEQLTLLISEKEAEIKQESILLNQQFIEVYHHLQPLTLIKNKLKDIISDTELIIDLKKVSVNIATTLATGLMLRATRHQPVKRGIGLLTSLAIRFATARFFEAQKRQSNVNQQEEVEL
ncbi:MAG: hypothetical protein ACK5Z2_11060 [Bacteroidota bacterium]|jgi:hypothetical protein